MGYICNCAKDHNLTQYHYDIIAEGKELRLSCINCGFDIVIGADEEPDMFDVGKMCYNMYSFYTKDLIENNEFERLERLIDVASSGK